MMWRKGILWTLTLSVAGLIFWLSSQSAEQSSALSGDISQGLLAGVLAFLKLSSAQQAAFHELLRSAAHVTLFALLGWCSSLLVRCYTKRRWWWIAGGACFLYAVLDECHQQWFAAGRAFELADIAKDTAGAAVAIALVAVACRLRRSKKDTVKDW